MSCVGSELGKVETSDGLLVDREGNMYVFDTYILRLFRMDCWASACPLRPPTTNVCLCTYHFWIGIRVKRVAFVSVNVNKCSSALLSDGLFSLCGTCS